MTTTTVETFRALHHGDGPLLLPNAWDAGSARILRSLGARALATTSGGAAAAAGVLDGELDADAMLAHCAALTDAVDLPVSADLENGYADDPAGVAITFRRAGASDLAGASIEDWSGATIYERGHAAERVAAAVDAAAGELVVTARAENHIRGRDDPRDLDDTIARLVDYERAGADVVYAPGLRTREQIVAVLEAVGVPLNVLAVPGAPPVAELAELGVRRISVGAAFALHAYAALADAATELLTAGTYGWADGAARGRALARDAFAAPED